MKSKMKVGTVKSTKEILKHIEKHFKKFTVETIPSDGDEWSSKDIHRNCQINIKPFYNKYKIEIYKNAYKYYDSDLDIEKLITPIQLISLLQGNFLESENILFRFNINFNKNKTKRR